MFVNVFVLDDMCSHGMSNICFCHSIRRVYCNVQFKSPSCHDLASINAASQADSLHEWFVGH